MIIRFVASTPFRTFLLYPLLLVAWELIVRHGELRVQPVFIPIVMWGYLQYRVVRDYRMKYGGGGYGFATAPDGLVVTGIFAYTRNPMYLGHIIFMIGVSLTLDSWLGALLTVVLMVWFHRRVLRDEVRLAEKFGAAYDDYKANVKRWVPGLF